MLAALVDASLVQVEMPTESASRLSMLDLVREYALDALRLHRRSHVAAAMPPIMPTWESRLRLLGQVRGQARHSWCWTFPMPVRPCSGQKSDRKPH